MEEKKHVVNLTIVLFKESITDYKEACETVPGLTLVDIKDSFSFEGKIVYCKSKKTPPKWKSLIDELSESKVDLLDNTSNKAAIIVKIKGRFMAVVLGYGKSLLREDKFERNFGLKTALNIIAKDQLRSVQSAAIEDMIVSTHRQASRRAKQEEFDLNSFSDILRSITGKPHNEDYGNTVSGKDTLSISIPMDIDELGEKLELYLDAYQDTRYKSIGFAWVDNVNEIRDPEIKKKLNDALCAALLAKKIEDIIIVPPEIIDLELIEGFCFTGLGKKTADASNYTYEPDFLEYVTCNENKDKVQLLDKLRRDKLVSIDANGNSQIMCNIYNAIVWQYTLNRKTYILWNGSWYYVEQAFVHEVAEYLNTIPVITLSLPKCRAGEREGLYNERAANNDATLCLMDQKEVGVKGGARQIESCDLFTQKKQLIHVKKRERSSQLSLLFSQGRVSAECFKSDEQYRKEVYELIKGKLGSNIFDYRKRPQPNEFEVIYAIISEKRFATLDKLPFFSKVNLMLTCQSLDRISFKYSVCFIEQE